MEFIFLSFRIKKWSVALMDTKSVRESRYEYWPTFKKVLALIPATAMNTVTHVRITHHKLN
jgi:hypothetical protein